MGSVLKLILAVLFHTLISGGKNVRDAFYGLSPGQLLPCAELSLAWKMFAMPEHGLPYCPPFAHKSSRLSTPLKRAIRSIYINSLSNQHSHLECI